MQLLAWEVSANYYTRPPGIVSLSILTNYIQAVSSHTQGMFNNHTTHSLYGIMITVTSVMGVLKMGNIVPRVGMEPISLAFRASVLPLDHIGSLMLPLNPRPPVYAAL